MGTIIDSYKKHVIPTIISNIQTEISIIEKNNSSNKERKKAWDRIIGFAIAGKEREDYYKKLYEKEKK